MGLWVAAGSSFMINTEIWSFWYHLYLFLPFCNIMCVMYLLAAHVSLGLHFRHTAHDSREAQSCLGNLWYDLWRRWFL